MYSRAERHSSKPAGDFLLLKVCFLFPLEVVAIIGGHVIVVVFSSILSLPYNTKFLEATVVVI